MVAISALRKGLNKLRRKAKQIYISKYILYIHELNIFFKILVTFIQSPG